MEKGLGIGDWALVGEKDRVHHGGHGGARRKAGRRRGTGGREKAKSEKRENGKWKAEGGEAEIENEEGKVGEVEK